jgi:GNAT superfamily N-acetyltransferase
MTNETKPAMLAISELDSARFGLNVARGRVQSVSAKDLATELIASDYDIAILRLPSGKSNELSAISTWGLPYIHADTLVYYRCDLAKYEPNPLRNVDLSYSIASDSDMAELRSLIRTTFRDYKSHYHANHLLAGDAILAGYQEWAEGHLGGAGRSLWVARRDAKIVAFAACQRHDEHTFEGILYGVLPEAAGGGLYGDLIRHTQSVAKSEGASVMRVSTQSHNFAVQKVWAREGFYLVESWDTYHINALRAFGEAIYDTPINFSRERIREFAEVTGDDNPLHLDALAAKASGLSAPIAHGVMTLGEVSRVLGTIAPGPGTLILHMDVAYFKPIVADLDYRLVMKAPLSRGLGRPYEVVSTITDSSGTPCVIARSTVLQRK